MLKKYLLLPLFLLLTGICFFILLRLHSKDIDVPSILSKSLSFPGNTKGPSQTAIKHVFVIVEENHDWTSILGNTDAPFTNNTLLTQGAYARNYHNVPTSTGELHPSELNYIFLEAGAVTFPDQSFTTDDNPSQSNSTSSQNHLVTLLEKKGYTWKSYQEDISGTDCPISPIDNYVPRHNPFVFFQNISGNPPSTDNSYCRNHIRPLSQLQSDLASGNVPNYVFIAPNLQHDMHNGTIAQADSWLSQIVPQITNSQTFKKDSVLFITWDEGSEDSNDSNGNNSIGMIVLSPFAKKGYTNTTEYSHASLLKTIQEIFQLQPLLGEAGNPQTKDLSAFFQ